MMSDIEVQEQRRLWKLMRNIEPPQAAQTRILNRIESKSASSRWVGGTVVFSLAAACAIFLFVYLQKDTTNKEHVSEVIVAEGVVQDDRVLSSGDTIHGSSLKISQSGHLLARLDQASLQAYGPSTLRLADKEVILSSGSISVLGKASVVGPHCIAEIAGENQISVSEQRLQVTVFAGSASITPQVEECLVVYAKREDTPKADPVPETEAAIKPDSTRVIEPAPSDSEVEQALVEDAEKQAPTTKPLRQRKPDRRGVRDVELNQQSAVYWQVQKLRSSNPSLALESLFSFVKKWPRSPLRPEIDLATIDTLLQLNKGADAKAAARRFLRRYPKSPRSAELREIVAQ